MLYVTISIRYNLLIWTLKIINLDKKIMNYESTVRSFTKIVEAEAERLFRNCKDAIDSYEMLSSDLNHEGEELLLQNPNDKEEMDEMMESLLSGRGMHFVERMRRDEQKIKRGSVAAARGVPRACVWSPRTTRAQHQLEMERGYKQPGARGVIWNNKL